MTDVTEESIVDLIKAYSPFANQGNHRTSISTMNEIWYYLLSNQILDYKPYPLTNRIYGILVKVMNKEKDLLAHMEIDTSIRFSEILLPPDSTDRDYLETMRALKLDKVSLASQVKLEGIIGSHELDVYRRYVTYLSCLTSFASDLKEIKP